MKKSGNKSVPKKSIFAEGEKLYPISKECDDKCSKNYVIKNWADIFYNLKEGKFKKRFIDIIKKSEYSSFFEGLNYEYGINNCKKDLVKALSIYKKAANNSFDTLSMLRLHYIYKKDFLKFNILKRNRIYEKFYLFKSFCFLDNQQIAREEFLFNRFDIFYEIYLHISIEENDQMNIFPKFIKFLRKNMNQIPEPIQPHLNDPFPMQMNPNMNIMNQPNMTPIINNQQNLPQNLQIQPRLNQQMPNNPQNEDTSK